MKDLNEKMEQNQTLEKFTLITAAALLVPAGIALCQAEMSIIGIILIVIGVGSLWFRELIKLKK